MPLNEFKKNYYQLKRDSDIFMYGYVLRIISSKNASTNELEMQKALVLTAERDIICVEVWDKSFILSKTFPKENTYVFLDNLTYMQTVLIKKRENTIETYTNPVEPAAIAQDDQRIFVYD